MSDVQSGPAQPGPAKPAPAPGKAIALSAPPPPADGQAWPISSLPGKIGKATRYSNMAILGLVFGFIGWAAVVPLAGAAIAPGIVSPEGSKKAIQSLEGGIVRKILVKDGELVQAGQTLVQLDTVQSSASAGAMEAQWMRLRAMRQRLLAVQRGDKEIKFDQDIVDAAKTTPDLAAFLDNERALLKAGVGTKQGQDDILRQQIEQSKEEIVGIQAVVKGLNRQLELIADELNGLHQLERKGLVRRQRVLELERAKAGLEGERSSNLAAIARAGQRISQIEVQRLAAGTEFERNQSQEVLSTNAQIAEIEEKLTAARDVLARTTITAPVTGKIVNLVVKSPGAVLRASEPMMEIVPTEVGLFIKARLQPNDIDSVHPGLKADIQLTPYSHRYAKRLQGTVTDVSADTMVDEATRQSYYTVSIVVDAEELAGVAPGAVLFPGMPAEVFIDLGERTMLGYLFEPITRTMNRAFKEQS